MEKSCSTLEQYKHELEQIEVSKADKTKPERLLNSKRAYSIPRRCGSCKCRRCALQKGHLNLAVHASITNCRVPVSVLSWQSKKNKRVVRSSLAAETSSMQTCQEHLDSMRTMWEQMTRSEFVLENYEQFLTARPSILVTDWKKPSRCIKQGKSSSSVNRQEIGT